MGRKNSGSVGGRMTSRRDFLRLAGGATGAASIGLFTSCRPETTTAGVTGETPEASEGRQEVGSAAGQGRLLARPAPVSPNAEVPTGLQPLGLGSGRDGLLYVPEGYGRKGEAPLALTLHGAGGNARGGISHLLDLADESGTILLAPESRGRTWDVLVGGYGPDVEFIDRALEQTFDRLAVNAEKLAVTGFSDGASYALSLGLTNGDFFTHVIAFSPGFAAPAGYRGKPSIFVSHGTHDEVLPIRQTSRQIVPELERKGYEVHYREFDGYHGVPKPVASEALEWFTEG